jgi:hypothetical protein
MRQRRIVNACRLGREVGDEPFGFAEGGVAPQAWAHEHRSKLGEQHRRAERLYSAVERRLEDQRRWSER